MSNGLHPCSIFSKESENTLVPQPIPSPIGITMTNAISESLVSRINEAFERLEAGKARYRIVLDLDF